MLSASGDSASKTRAVIAGSSGAAGADSEPAASVGLTTVVPPGWRNLTPIPIPPPWFTTANDPIFWRTPSSATSKSLWDRSVTRPPFLSRTTTSTRIAVACVVKVLVLCCLSGAGDCPRADDPTCSSETRTRTIEKRLMEPCPI